LAFYSILSIAPLVVIVVAIVALVFGHSSAQDQIIAIVKAIVGQDGANAVRTMLGHSSQPSSGLFASSVSTIALLFGASGVFAELKGALNKMWEIEPKPDRGPWEIVRKYVFSFGVVVAVGCLLLVALIFNAGLAALGQFFADRLPLGETLISAMNVAFSLPVIGFLFALVFRYVPDAVVPWKSALLGGLATSCMFAVGRHAIGLYLGRAAFVSTYGAAGSLVAVIVWVYYSAMIFMFGAEFTHVLSQKHSV
jgi:membrane protein